jgi:hypothetical protein
MQRMTEAELSQCLINEFDHNAPLSQSSYKNLAHTKTIKWFQAQITQKQFIKK